MDSMSDETNSTVEAVEDDPVGAKLRGLGVDDEQIRRIREELGAESVDDLPFLTVEQLGGIGIKPARAGRIVSELKPAPVAVADAFAVNAQVDSILPSLPSDESWLQ